MRRSLAAAALATCLAIAALPAPAIESVRLQAASVVVAGTTTRDVTATLVIHSGTRSSLSVHAAGVAVPAALAAQAGSQVAVRVDCDNPVIREPVFDCPALTLQVWTQRWPPLTLRGTVAWRSDSGTLTATGTGPDVAGSPVKFNASMQGDATRAQLDLPSVSLAGTGGTAQTLGHVAR